MADQTLLHIKGSWEDLLEQANDLATRDNDQCVPLWQKVMDRLSLLPAVRLDAGDGHLRKLRQIAATNLQQYLVSRQHYDEALNVIDRLAIEIEPQESEHWQQTAIRTLIFAGRKEEAIAKAKAAAETAESDDIDTWANLVYTAIAEKAFPVAEEALREIERRLNRARKEHGAENTKEDSAYLSWLRANYALEQQLWDEAIAWWTHARTQDNFYEGEVHNIYIKLIRAGELTRALPLIEHDKQNQVRSDFWRGLALTRLGKEKEGAQYWRRIATIDATDESLPYSLVEYFLAHYYLPELRDEGLVRNLNIVREVEDLEWQFHYLLGLGFAIHNNLEDAHIHLAEAQLRHRRAAFGAKIRPEVWFPFEDLVEEVNRNEFKKYFNL